MKDEEWCRIIDETLDEVVRHFQIDGKGKAYPQDIVLFIRHTITDKYPIQKQSEE